MVKVRSSSKVKYTDEGGKAHTEKIDAGMNIRPITMDFLLQAGLCRVGVYVKYSAFSLFEHDKGPNVHPVSLGLMWYLF